MKLTTVHTGIHRLFPGRSAWLRTALLLVPGLAVCACAAVKPSDPDRFSDRLTLASGETIVVEEPEYEARSIGSFSVRVYAPAGSGDATTFFKSGIVRARDGVVEKIMKADVDGDGTEEVVVVARSVGTGNYLSAWAFSYRNGTLVSLAEVLALPADADPVRALRAWYQASEPGSLPGRQQCPKHH